MRGSANVPAAMLRQKRALQRWRQIGEKLADLMTFIGLRASVLAWLPSSSSQLLGLDSLLLPVRQAVGVQGDQQTLQVPLGVREMKDPPKKVVTACDTRRKSIAAQKPLEVHDAREAHGSEEDVEQTYVGAVGCDLNSSLDVQSGGRFELGSGALRMQKPAHRWQVKKEGCTEGRHFYLRGKGMRVLPVGVRRSGMPARSPQTWMWTRRKSSTRKPGRTGRAKRWRPGFAKRSGGTRRRIKRRRRGRGWSG